MLPFRSGCAASLPFSLVRVCLATAALGLGACEKVEFDCGYSCPPDTMWKPGPGEPAIDAREAQFACEKEIRDSCAEGQIRCKCIQPGQELADVFTLSVEPETLQLRPGESRPIDVTLHANAVIGVINEVHFQLGNLPEPLVGRFSPEAAKSATPSSQLTIEVPPGTAAGTYGDIEVSVFLLGEEIAHRSLTVHVVETDFSFDVRPDHVDFASAGSTVDLTLEVGSVNLFEGTVSLTMDALPDDVTVVRPITPTSLEVRTFLPSRADLRLRFTPTPPVPASASIVLTASGPGGLSHSRTVTLNYPLATAGDFTLAVDPGHAELVLTPGGTDTTTVHVTVTGAPGPIQLAASGLPPGVTASFDPPEVTGTGTSRLTLSASPQAVPGPPATFSLYGSTADGLSHIVPVQISIIPR